MPVWGAQNPAYRPSPIFFLSLHPMRAGGIISAGEVRNGAPGEARPSAMQDRLNQNDVTNRVNVEKPKEVRDAILRIFNTRYPGANFAPLERAFDDIHALFEGRYPGFVACDTLYHDMRHTLDMTLAMARLVDGHDRSCAPTERLGARRAVMGVLIALLHDAGYLKRSSETSVGNGAVFTKVHVSRSADFIASYLPQIGFGAEAALAARLVHFTGYEM